MRWSEQQLADHLAKTGVPSKAVDAVDVSAPPFAVSDCARDPVTLTLCVEPQGKGRARAVLRNGHIAHYTPVKTATYEGMIKAAAIVAMGNREPIELPVSLNLRAVFPIPVSWSGAKRNKAMTGDIKPGKPDLDNITKAWSDALNGVVYRDDSLICELTAKKAYGPQALVAVTVRVMA